MNLTPRKKNPKSRNKDNSTDKFADKGLKEKVVRQKTEQKINTDEQVKAQSIIRQAEVKAQSIIRQAEVKARSESIEKRMTNQEITKTVDYYHQEEAEEVPIKLKENNYRENNKPSNLFMPGFSMWQDYAKIWMEFSKETANNTTKKVFRYFENNNEKN